MAGDAALLEEGPRVPCNWVAVVGADSPWVAEGAAELHDHWLYQSVLMAGRMCMGRD